MGPKTKALCRQAFLLATAGGAAFVAAARGGGVPSPLRVFVASAGVSVCGVHLLLLAGLASGFVVARGETRAEMFGPDDDDWVD